MIYNEILEGGFNGLLVRRLAMQVPTAAPALQPEIVADITLENDRPEWGPLKSEFRYGRLITRAALAPGFHAAAQFTLPITTSGTIATIEGLQASVESFVYLDSNDGSFTAAAVASKGFARDVRGPGASQADVTEGFSTTLGIALQDKAFRIAPNQLIDLPIVVCPRPGTPVLQYKVTIVSTVDQIAADFGFFWRERTGNPSELV